MDHRWLFAFLIVFTTVNCQDTVNSTTKEDIVVVTNETVPAVTVKLPSFCTVCSCAGDNVTCDRKNLTNQFEDSQWTVKSVNVMSFTENSLGHVKPFPEVAIVSLILRANQITKIDDGAFMKLINLTELDLSHNNLTAENLQPNAFQGRFSKKYYEPLPKLTRLSLAYNKLHSMHQDLFVHVPNLKVLDLSHNMFTRIDQRTVFAITSLAKLEELNLGYCGLKDIPDTFLYSLRKLTKLNISGNQINAPPADLGEAISLQYLYMDENPIQIINENISFPSMPKLKELSLCCMPHLTVIGKGAFGGLQSLEHVRIKNCPKLETIDEYAFANKTKESEEPQWPFLKKLDLSDNALRYLPAHIVGAEWDTLEELDLTNNHWSCDCQNEYLIGTLLPKQGKRLMAENAGKLMCSAPPEHLGKSLESLANKKLRCLDFYGARPERDATILVGVLIGVLTVTPICLTLFVLWRRGFFFCGSNKPASFSRAFYKRTTSDDDI